MYLKFPGGMDRASKGKRIDIKRDRETRMERAETHRGRTKNTPTHRPHTHKEKRKRGKLRALFIILAARDSSIPLSD